jgi:hypothetical protein
VGAGWSVRAEETHVMDFAVDKVGLQVVEGLWGVEAGLMVV